MHPRQRLGDGAGRRRTTPGGPRGILQRSVREEGSQTQGKIPVEGRRSEATRAKASACASGEGAWPGRFHAKEPGQRRETHDQDGRTGRTSPHVSINSLVSAADDRSSRQLLSYDLRRLGYAMPVPASDLDREAGDTNRAHES